MMFSKLRVAILGSGNIGTDLLLKILKSKSLECCLFIGRNPQSKGIVRAQKLGIRTSCKGIEAILEDVDCCDLVFDATSAKEHTIHWPLLQKLNKIVIDMTPAHLGKQIIPAINLQEISQHQNINMVSCGGQASVPLAYMVSKLIPNIEYIEVVSSIASDSAGPATRINLDEYIENTEEALRIFTGCGKVKAILILNPAQPCIDMQTTISLKTTCPDMSAVQKAIVDMERKMQQYVPGYQIIVSPVFETNRIFISVQVRGVGDYLPTYAGNLDIINCAAIMAAEEYARQSFCKEQKLCRIY